MADRLAGLVAMSSGDGRLDTLIRLTCGRALSLPPLPTEVDLLDEHTVGESVVAGSESAVAREPVTGAPAARRAASKVRVLDVASMPLDRIAST